jgi:hypothetical protein
MARASKVLGIVVFFVLFTSLVAVSPLVAGGLAIVIAIAWCIYLERHPALPGTVSAFFFVLCLAGSAAAQSTPPPDGAPAAEPQAAQPTDNPWRNIKFGATFEGYYQYNWNRPPDRSVALRAYDTRGNTFGMQQVALVVDAAPDVDANRRYGLRVDLQFGQATETVQGSPANEPRPDVYRHVWQAYGGYVFPVANGLQTDFGKFASMLGYETNYAKDNQAFSRAYLFNFLPFYHMGLRATLPINDKVSVLYMLTNGIQQTEEFNDFKSSHVAAIVKPAPMLAWTVNYYFGQEQADNGAPDGPDGFFRVFDTYVTVTPTAALTLGADVNYVTNEITTVTNGNVDVTDGSINELSLQGLGLYARYQFNTPAALGVRYERLDDEGLFGGIDQVLQEITVTGEYKLTDAFIIRAEYRRDWSNELFFPGRLGATDPRSHQNTVLLGGIWVIGNKTGVW